MLTTSARDRVASGRGVRGGTLPTKCSAIALPAVAWGHAGVERAVDGAATASTRRFVSRRMVVVMVHGVDVSSEREPSGPDEEVADRWWTTTSHPFWDRLEPDPRCSASR
jgi:hypothetical protein